MLVGKIRILALTPIDAAQAISVPMSCQIGSLVSLGLRDRRQLQEPEINVQFRELKMQEPEIN